MPANSDLNVYISIKESWCDECGECLGRKAWIFMTRHRGALCLACADMDHLLFLPSGDAALTRRTRKHSTLNAVVLKWSRARKRYERQGLLVEEQALEKAEQECLADSEVRARRRERDAERRVELDQKYIDSFAKRVRELFPKCPVKREFSIAKHACLKYSGRIGRSANAKNFDENAVHLAVQAHIRHTETEYDSLLMKGCDRSDARGIIQATVDSVLLKWRKS